MASLRPREGFVGEARKTIRAKKSKPRVKRKWRFRFRRSAVLIIFLILLVGSINLLFIMPNNTGRDVSTDIRETADHVVINEIYYDAPTGYDEPQCEWIELYNPTPNAVDISGWMLSDDPARDTSNEGVWTFPSGTVIPAGGYLLIVNDATYKGEFNSLFPGVTPDFDTNSSNSIPDVSSAGSLSLANNGDDVHLFDSNGNEIDVMWYGNGGDMGSTDAAPDVAQGHSVARYYNAEDTGNPSADFYDESNPTPGAQNPQTIPEITSFAVLVPAAIIFVIFRRRTNSS